MKGSFYVIVPRIFVLHCSLWEDNVDSEDQSSVSGVVVFLCYCTLDHVTRKNPMCYRLVVVEIKLSKNLIEASHLLSFVVWSQERYMV